MPPRPSWSDLARYLEGESTVAQGRRVEAWCDADSANRQLLDELGRLWALAAEQPGGYEVSPRQTEADWEEVRRQMRARAEARAREERSATRQRRKARRRLAARHARSRALRWIPALAAVFVVGALVLWGLPAGEEPGAGEAPLQEIATGRGERARVRLADGTEVTLNVDSRVELPRSFGQDAREVRLQGEAYFDVESEDRPFIVRIAEARVQVHGTAFNVRSYPEERDVEVTVSEGSVSLHGEKEGQAMLRPGQMGRLETVNGRLTRQAVDLDTHLGWTQGRLVFDDASIVQVAAQLERWYDLDVVIEDDRLRTLRLTASLKSRSVRDVLNVVAATLGIRYRIDGDVVYLAPAS